MVTAHTTIQIDGYIGAIDVIYSSIGYGLVIITSVIYLVTE